MKKIVLILGLLLLATSVSFGQRSGDTGKNLSIVVIEGTQTKGSAGKNAELYSVPVQIPVSMEIISVEGNNNGFWITKGSVTIYTFDSMNEAVGTVLQPGTYYVYPNLNKNSNSARVTVYLK